MWMRLRVITGMAAGKAEYLIAEGAIMGKTILYEQIYREMKMKIEDGEYAPGERLPSEMEIAGKYGVSRITSKQAMNMLAERGLITRSPGRGSFVCDGIESDAKDSSTISGRGGTESVHTRRKIGFLMDSFGITFGCNLLRAVERECRDQDYDLILKCSEGNIEAESKAIDELLADGISGLILISVQGEVYNEKILRLSLEDFPMVLVDREMKGIPIPCVRTDNYKASYRLTEQLISVGHKNICFVTHSFTETPTIKERYNGFTDCILEHDGIKGSLITLKRFHPYQGYDRGELREIAGQSSEFTGFVASQYTVGSTLQYMIHTLGLTSKEVVSFDCLDDIFTETYQFTHIKQDETAMGKRAVEILCAVIGGKKVKGTVNIPYQLVKKRETALITNK